MTEFDLPAKSWFQRYKTNFALKDALIQYKASEDKNTDMIEYLCEYLLDNKEEVVLFYPEIIRCLILCLPYNHKIISSFIPDEIAAKEFLLFEKNFKNYKNFRSDPYLAYYSYEIRVGMWGDFSDIFVSDLYPNLIENLFAKIDFVSENHHFEHLIAEVYRKLLISSFKL